MDRYLSASQLGITIASLVLGRVGEPYIANLLESLFKHYNFEISESALHTLSFTTGIAFITVIHMVIGEQVPKHFPYAIHLKHH